MDSIHEPIILCPVGFVKEKFDLFSVKPEEEEKLPDKTKYRNRIKTALLRILSESLPAPRYPQPHRPLKVYVFVSIDSAKNNCV